MAILAAKGELTMASYPTITVSDNGMGFTSTYKVLSGAGSTQQKTPAQPTQSPGVPSIVTVQPFKPTTTELVIVGGLAAVAVFYFATHNKGK